MTFKRWGDEFPYVLRFLGCFAAMIVELLWENIMVWYVCILATAQQALPICIRCIAPVQQQDTPVLLTAVQ